MSSFAVPFETGFRQATINLLKTFTEGNRQEMQASTDLVLTGGASHGALWQSNGVFEFVPADTATGALEALAMRRFDSREAFLAEAIGKGLEVQLTPVRF